MQNLKQQFMNGSLHMDAILYATGASILFCQHILFHLRTIKYLISPIVHKKTDKVSVLYRKLIIIFQIFQYRNIINWIIIQT